MKHLHLISLLVLFPAACSLLPNEAAPAPRISEPMRMSNGMGPGMMQRHHAQIPAAYAGKTSPALDENEVASGQALYQSLCASCHGDTGMGEGSAGVSLNPTPSPIAHTSQMLGDDYLLWRISEGGSLFQSAMPAWKEVLDEGSRWQVIAYVRRLGRDGDAAIEQNQAQRQSEMLSNALAQGVLTQAEVDAFEIVHSKLEAYLEENPDPGKSMDERETAALQVLLKSKAISQAQADLFSIAHDKLANSGLMP